MESRYISKQILKVTPLIKSYLCKIMDNIHDITKTRMQFSIISPEKLFNILVSDDFCYLTKKQVAPYKESIIKTCKMTIDKKEPLKMYLDLGPGYHAAVEPEGERKLSFDIGLCELLVLYQIRKFFNKVAEIYSPGSEFFIIIDNLCGNIVNSIKIKDTELYCKKFRELIKTLNMDNQVELIVESENFSISDYNIIPLNEKEIKSTKLTAWEHENVKRFLGYECSMEEAVKRSLTYKQVGPRTDELFSKFFNNGIHMTQRASKSTICFRAFPGADSRTQSGKVVLGQNRKNKIYPFLLTSISYPKFRYEHYSFPRILPSQIKEVTYAHLRNIRK